MPKISAILHCHNDAQRLGRALESLRACDEVIVVDHSSSDHSAKIAREHGASVKNGVPGVEPGAYVVDARNDWILCLRPNESLGESLEAALFEWKHGEPGEVTGFRVAIRAENRRRWAMPKNDKEEQNEALIALLTSLGAQIEDALEEMGLGPDDDSDPDPDDGDD